jgi:hypothetical protein
MNRFHNQTLKVKGMLFVVERIYWRIVRTGEAYAHFGKCQPMAPGIAPDNAEVFV